jgi:hypothetical protein
VAAVEETTAINDPSRVLPIMDRLDRVMVTGAATAEAIAPSDEADSFPSSQINRNTKIVDAATTNIIVQQEMEGYGREG